MPFGLLDRHFPDRKKGARLHARFAPEPRGMSFKSRLFALACALLALATAGAPAAGQDRQAAPESATGWRRVGPATAKSYMVSAANPMAVEAGLEVLREGGSAADAAIAVQLVLNLVEPQSSGLGGGAFALHWDAAKKQLKGYDGRESAPAAATPDRFLIEGRPRPFDEAVFGGLSVGVPGALRLLETLHKQHGRLPWPRLFAPAIKLASDGFRVSPRLHLLLRWQGAQSFAPAARRYFFDTTGSAWPAGYLLRNPAFAATLRAVAERGPDAFYTGAVAAAIVDAVRQAPNHQGDITAADLAGYRVKEREPVCVGYRRLRVCGMGPPSSGGMAVAQILKLLEPFDLGQGAAEAMNGKAMHLIAEAEKLAFADRNQYLADPDFVPTPMGLLDADYLAGRRALIKPEAVMGLAHPGHAAASRGRAPRRRRDGGAAGHQPLLDRRSRRQRDLHDDHHRIRLRLAPVGRGLSVEQRAHRLRLPPHRWRRPAVGQRGRAGQAPQKLDGADHRLRCAGQALGRAGIARGQPYHSLCGQGAGGADRLEARRPGRPRPHELRQPRRGLRDRS